MFAGTVKMSRDVIPILGVGMGRWQCDPPRGAGVGCDSDGTLAVVGGPKGGLTGDGERDTRGACRAAAR